MKFSGNFLVVKLLLGASGDLGASAKPFSKCRREGPDSSHLRKAKAFSKKDLASGNPSPGRTEGVIRKVGIIFFSLSIILNPKFILGEKPGLYPHTEETLALSFTSDVTPGCCPRNFQSQTTSVFKWEKEIKVSEDSTGSRGLNFALTEEWKEGSFQTQNIKKSIIPHTKLNSTILYSGHSPPRATVWFKMP